MKKQSFLPHSLSKLKMVSPLVLFLSLSLYAQSSSLTEFNQFYKSGQYLKALTALEKSNSNDFLLGQHAYLEGLCYSKLQEYDKAIKSFEKAISEKNGNTDLQYEYGQALYAANELKAARKAFKESAAKKFNAPASIYYVAHISQILEEYPAAKDSYTELIKSKEADTKIKQIARFQLTETLLLMMREKIQNKDELEKNVAKYIVPMLRQAYSTDKSSQAAYEIEQRLHEIQKEFNLDPDLLANGRRISSKRYSGYISQKIKFDDNISLTNEENNIQQSKKESFIFESEGYAKYDFVLKKRFIVSPEVRITFVQNSDQDSPEVYQNDNFSINANLKNKYEHLVNGQPASFLFDIELGKTLKDWKQTHKREAYSNTMNLGIGEAFNYFSAGDTSFKIKRKNFTGVNELISNHTISVSGDQTISFTNQHLLIALIEADFINNYNNTPSNTNTYLARFDYLVPEIMSKYTLGLALATTITDTKEQNATRGTELTLNPSIDLSKEINEKMKISVNYDYTKNKSKQSDYDYKKHVFSTEFRYSF
ncbi:MAG: tetratricopeptide repeat protein [Bacteriovorax sp.]|nr:tetratricopeptide repeat protein [Bacteriovorax sp.]